ncbi:MAG: helix-turn-helix domain-containing protein [Tateyamaria sp.]|uniref:helix-turn-helix transcriptional regulator n=1 Tax=Tateyamaria sp. TaxID=1929288 RepID=UPI00326E449A
MTDLEYLTPIDLSKLIQVPLNTLANWRCVGAGPNYVKLGQRIRYPAADVQEWIEAGRQDRGAA